MAFNKIVKAISWYSITRFATVISSVVSIAIFTRLLTVDEYGQIAIFLSWVAILTPILSVGLSLSIPRSQIEFPESLKEYTMTLVIFSVVSSILVISVVNFFRLDIWSLTGIDQRLAVPFFIYLLAGVIVSICISSAQYSMNYRAVSFITLFKAYGMLFFAFMAISYIYSDPVDGRIYGGAVSEVVAAIMALLILLKIDFKKLSIEYLKFGLSYSAPFIIGSVAAVLNAQFDRIMIGSMVSNSDAGIYSLGTTIGVLSFTFWVAMRQALIPWLYRAYSTESYVSIRILYDFMGWFTLIATICGMLIAKDIVVSLSSEEYWEASGVVVVILCCSYIQILSLNETETQMFHKKTLANTIIIVLGVAVNILLNYIFIPIYGYEAAMYTTLISYSLMHFTFLTYNVYVLRVDVASVWGYITKILVSILAAILIINVFEYRLLRYILLIIFVLSMVLYVRLRLPEIRVLLNDN